MKERTCPYCGKPMVRGYIQSSRTLSWLPKRLKLFTAAGFMGHDALVLSEGAGIGAPCVIAYKCEACQKIVIDYENNACDFYTAEADERGIPNGD